MEDNRDVVVGVGLKPNDVYTPFSWSTGNLVRWVISFVLCLIFYDVYKGSQEVISSVQGGESILAVMALLALFILFALLVFPYLRMRAKFRKSPAMTMMWLYTFTATGIRIQSDDATSDCKWSLFLRAWESPSVFVFSLTTHGAIYVPKRCFASSNDVARLRELIRNNMPGKWRLRRD